MIVRIETTGLARGREFNLYAFAQNTPSVSMAAYNPVTNNVVPLDYTHKSNGDVHIFSSTAAHFDGFLLAKVGNQKIVKKIGTPSQDKFVVGWKDGYTCFYKAYDQNGEVIEEGRMANIADGFFAIRIPDDAIMMEAAGKKVLINKNIQKLSYEVTMSGGELKSNVGNVALDSIKLPDIELPDSTLDSTMPDVTIKEL